MGRVKLRVLRRILFGVVDSILPDFRYLMKWRGYAARIILGFKGATALRLRKGVDFGEHFEQVSIGEHCAFGANCIFFVWPPATITLGSRVRVAAHSIFWSGSHEIGDEYQRSGETTLTSIEIGNGCWIGLRATIHKSVEAGSIVDSNTLIVKNMPGNVLIRGNPGRIARELPTKNESLKPLT